MNDIQLKYHPFNVTIHFCTGLVFFGLLATVLIQTPNKIAGIVFVTILLLIVGPVYFLSVRNFVRLLLGQSCLILNREYYIDNINDIKIKWTEINSIGSSAFGQWTFLTFNLTDNSIVSRQLRNPIYRLLLRLESILTKSSFKTNSSFIRGDNKEVFWTVFNYHKNIQTNYVEQTSR